MAPGGNVYQDVTESRGALSNYGVKSASVELRSGIRLCGSSGKRSGMVSNSAVHDLLECPVCLNIMCPPIHQVHSVFLY